MSTAVPSAPPAYAPPFVQPPQPKGARRPMLFALGAAVAAIGATGSVWYSAAGNKKIDVIVVARDVPFGATVTAADLTTAQANLDGTVKAMHADQASSVIGKRAMTELISGSLLTSGEVGSQAFPAAGQSIIAVPLKTTQIFYGLKAQSNVLLVATPVPSSNGQAAAAPMSPVAGVVLNVGAADSSGTVDVSVMVPAPEIGALEGLISTNQLQLAAAPPTAGS
jgi:hypothetical protein